MADSLSHGHCEVEISSSPSQRHVNETLGDKREKRFLKDPAYGRFSSTINAGIDRTISCL